jgi:DNA-binding LacI/PurR family transcriptional regulator
MAEEQDTEQSGPYLLYAKVETLIREEIEREGLKAGARLPTEAELCERFSVSRSTIRQALNRLEVAGLITRTRGKGTFVRALPVIDTLENIPLINRKTSSPFVSHKVLGLVFCARSDTLQMNILLGAERAAKSRGYALMFGYSGENKDTEAQEIERLLRIGADGVIVMPVSNQTTTPGVQMLIDHKMPFVLVDRYLSDLNTSYVVSDGFDGMYRVTEHLLILGYESFQFVKTEAEELTITSVRDRYQGYCKALEDYGRASEITPPISVRVEDKAAVAQFIGARPAKSAMPLAIVAVHDAVAISFTRTAASLGFTPPADFAIVGFDDLPTSGHLQVPLTTVAQPRYDLGFKSAHLVIDQIEGLISPDEKLVLPVSLVVRDSCGSRRIVQARRNSLHELFPVSVL